MKQLFYLVAGVVIGALGFARGQDATLDPVAISPQYYTVRFENDTVRVLEFRLKAGESEPMHRHPPGVVYYLSDASFRVTTPDGAVSEGAVTAGQVQWRSWTSHAAVNIGSTEAHALAVELKKCR
jgi:quercetin dioxygenase-like cupin family protein